MICSVVPGLGNYATAILAYIDCQAITLATRGYAALTSGNALVPTLLASLLTLYVIFWGYRLLAGDRPSSSELFPAFAAIAAALLLATSWPAYDRLIFRVALQTPGEIVSAIDLPVTGQSARYDLPARIDAVDGQMQRLAILGSGAARTPEELAYIRANVAPPLFANFDAFALGSSRLVFLSSAVGALALLRLLAGAFLALGPLIAVLLIFEATRGLVFGWLRSLGGIILATIIVMLVLYVELMLLDPWLRSLLGRRASEQTIAGAPAQLLASVLMFAGVIIGSLVAAVRLPGHLSLRMRDARTSVVPAAGEALGYAVGTRASADWASTGERNRARAIAEAVQVADHRRTRLAGSVVDIGAVTQPSVQAGRSAAIPALDVMQGTRRARPRSSASATVRDRR